MKSKRAIRNALIFIIAAYVACFIALAIFVGRGAPDDVYAILLMVATLWVIGVALIILLTKILERLENMSCKKKENQPE